MDKELRSNGRKTLIEPISPTRQVKATLPTIDIYGILASAFRTNLKQKKNEYFISLLYKIDRIF